MTDDVIDEPLTDETTVADGDAAGTGAAGPDAAGPVAQYGVGPFSVREVALAGVWLVAFVVSFFSVAVVGFASVWTSGLSWILSIGLPTVAVFLLVLRRLSPDGIRRVGSLGIDQFASVAFSVSALLWLQWVWETVAIAVDDGVWVRSWVAWVELALMLAGVVLTVFAPIVPVIGDDFRDRREVTAHRNARPIRAVVPRPKPEPRTPEPAPAPEYEANPYDTGSFDTGGYDPDAYVGSAHDTGSYEADRTVATGRSADAVAVAWEPEPRSAPAAEPAVEFAAEPVAAAQPVSQQPFWALAPNERDVYDAQGSPLFRIGPTAWALVVEDRGSVYVVRHEDGRIGYLHDVSGITRG